jgi:putative aldouronate transport system permease protein
VVVARARRQRIRPSVSDRAFNAVNNAFLVVIFVLVAYPLVYIVSCSFSSTNAIFKGQVWLFPREPTLIAYQEILRYQPVWVGYANTLFYTLVGTTINLIMTFLAAYPLSRKDFIGRKPIMFIFTLTMFFSGGVIPTYLVVKNLGMINSRLAMLIPNAMAVWNVIITRSFFENTIPGELLDASRIDGASDFQFLLRCVIPLSRAVIAVNILYYSVAHWNTFFNAFLYLSERKLYPLQLFLREILIMNSVTAPMMSATAHLDDATRQQLRELLKYSVIVVSTFPVMCLYSFMQKYFVKGVMLGSMKG